MSRDSDAYLADVLIACRKVIAYTEGMDCSAFCSDSKTFDAVIRNLEIIGEAAGKIPPEVCARDTSINWRRIAALRNLLIHEYFGVDPDIVWDIVTNKVPELANAVARLTNEST